MDIREQMDRDNVNGDRDFGEADFSHVRNLLRFHGDLGDNNNSQGKLGQPSNKEIELALNP